MSLLEVLNKYSTLLAAVATFITALVAIYLGSWKEMLRKPKLKLCFREDNTEPYCKSLSFGSLIDVKFCGQRLSITIPGYSARIKVSNEGQTTAKNVQARVEKIELIDKDNNPDRTISYHPTEVKWSGEFEWHPVDIVSESYFFLDLFLAINVTRQEVSHFNSLIYAAEIERDDLRVIVDEIIPFEDVYWNIWVKDPFERGLPGKLRHEGRIVIYYILNGENCDPLKFEAFVEWNRSDWNKPSIKVMHNNSRVKDC